MPFQSGNKEGSKRGKDKPFRDALRIEIAAAGEDQRELRKIARKLLDLAVAGDMQAIRELGDRIDGKVPQAIVGDDEHPPLVALQEFFARMRQPAPPADTSAAKEIADRLDGKVPQAIGGSDELSAIVTISWLDEPAK